MKHAETLALAKLVEEIASAKRRLAVLEPYAAETHRAGDWHGVMDAAVDIRETRAYLEGLEFAFALLAPP